MTQEEFWKLPKIELHCHLDGSIPRGALEELLGREVQEAEIQVSDDCESLAEYLEKFDLPLTCLQKAEQLELAAKAFLLEVAKENVVYVEVRFAPVLSVQDGLNCGQVMEAVLRGLCLAREICGVEFGVIACAMRHHSYEQNREMMHAVLPFLGKGVCGLDLAGNEAAFPMENFENLFEEARMLGFPFTLHAGECGSAENVRDSILCGARRIGHGIAMAGHEDVIALCRGRRVGVEMCPISNLQTKAVSDKSHYPMREFLDAGLLVTVNTDNRTVSNSALTRELAFIQREYGITDAEIRQMMHDALECSFAAPEIKAKIQKRLAPV